MEKETGDVEIEQKKNFRKQDHNFTFEQIKQALSTTYTLSTKMICEYLKTYRPWVSKYILPKLSKIYIPTGRGNSKSTANWVWWLRKFDNINIQESSWYKTSDFEKLLNDSLYSCTRQTISVSLTALLEENKRPLFLEEYIPLKEILEKARTDKDWRTFNLTEKKLNNLYAIYLGKDFIKSSEMYWNGAENVSVINAAYTKRTQTAPVPYEMEIEYTSLSAIHDLKGYGGVDEEIYRDLFVKGAVRLEYHFTAKNGEHGKKIFYCYDEEDKKTRFNDKAPIWTIPYSFWLENKKV